MKRNAQTLPERKRAPTGNFLLDSLPDADRALLEQHLEHGLVSRGDILFYAGQSIEFVTFPCSSAVATLTIAMRDGRTAKSATIGREGAIGGVVSQGQLPAFSQAAVLVGGADRADRRFGSANLKTTINTATESPYPLFRLPPRASSAIGGLQRAAFN